MTGYGTNFIVENWQRRAADSGAGVAANADACDLAIQCTGPHTEDIVRYKESRNELSPRYAGWMGAIFCVFGLLASTGGAVAQITLPAAGKINTLAGLGTATGDNGAASNAQLNTPFGVVLDTAGNYYIADTYNNRIRKVTVSTGTITTLAGTGAGGSSGDGGPATSAQLYNPSGVSVDSSGNLYIADSGNNRVRKITVSTGTITTVAGTGVAGFSGDDGAATSAQLSFPTGVAVNAAGDVYIADIDNSVIRKVSKASGMITTVAGNGTIEYSGDGGPATVAGLAYPNSIALDGSGNIYIADEENNCIRKVTVSTGIITTVAGNGTGGYSGDGSAATQAELDYPEAVALDSTGNLYIADSGNQFIRKVTVSTGVISTVAGTGWPSFCCDGGPALAAQLHFPSGIAVDSAGNFYIADTDNDRIRKVTISSGLINTIAGSTPFAGDNGSATAALLNFPAGVVVDASGNLYIGDNDNCRVRKVAASTGTITTFAGNGVACGTLGGNDTGDGGAATSAQLGGAQGLALDSAGNLYVAAGGAIREITPAGIISTVAGGYMNNFSGDGGPATSAALSFPQDEVVDSAGNLYIADTDNNRIRKVTASTGIINTIVGAGTAGYSGDGGAATGAAINGPSGLALDSAGNLYIADFGNGRVRKVTAAGVISTVAGNGDDAFSGDGGLAINAALGNPADVKLDSAGNLYIADFYNCVIRKVTAATGIITTIAGNSIIGYSGDGGLAIDAEMDSPVALALNSAGDVFIADQNNGRVRAVGPIGTTATVWDIGIVTLLVNNSALATATYGQGSTGTTIATALAAASAHSLVNVTAVDDALYLQAATPGVAGNAITYWLENTAYSSFEFTAPSFPAAASSGTLAGGDALGANGGQVVYKYNAVFDSAGNLSSDNDQVMGAWTFQYDTLNRLMSATDNETGNANTNYCWGYDAFGNRTIQAGSSAAFLVGSPSCTPSGTASLSATWSHLSGSNNQLASTNQALGGIIYDASGDVVNDGVSQYLYDGEGRICAVAYTPLPSQTTLTGYVYNASGERVSKGTITVWSCDPSISGFTATNDYVLGLGGEQVTEMVMAANNTMAWQHTNVFAAGNLMATYDDNGLHFHLNDVVGTRRIQTDYAGVVEQFCSGLPFGDELSCSNSIQFPTEHHFTGKERDVESGLDYFGARYYASNMGRFLSPDPVGGSLLNPQTLNKYAYVINNPLTNTDPTGLYVCATGQDCTAFEKSLAGLRDSKNADVSRAAGAYGALGDKNGVTVGFADLSKQGEDGKVTSSLGTDANGNLQAQSNVTINTGANGAAFDAAIGHEGSHVADAQDVVKSIVVDPKTGDFTVGNNITRYQSEQRAYGVTNSILSSEGVNANEGCNGCDLGRNTMQGQVPGIVDRIMRTGNNYMSGGQHMGPKNQGGSVVNGVDQTPKAAVPH